ncbi:unnamed protein product [Linum trigynum]|uniref:Integrase catalytic domain-containing protein n=1 Tax=Linum trigynum TaxID=586398 RepID=A0AAV2GDB4_9ROSI
MSTAYHPQTDGQTEVVNRCLEQYLRCFTQQHPRRWLALLPWTEFWYNYTYHRMIGTSPFRALYGREPPTVIPYHVQTSPVVGVDELLRERDAALASLRKNLAAANLKAKQLADASRRDVTYEAGEWVLLRLHPYHQSMVFRRASQKLAARYFGPYRILGRVGEVAYRLELPEGARIHPVFHVSLLKKYVGDPEIVLADAPSVNDDGELEIFPQEVLGHCWTRVRGGVIEECLVRWRHLPREEATWESYEEIRRRFPEFDLGDKVALQGGGD